MTISTKNHQEQRSVNWGGSGRFLPLIAILLLAILLGAPNQTQLANVQPALLAMIDAQPDETVAVIVQKTTDSELVEDQVVELGGLVTKQLSIINGFAAQLPAKVIPALAQTAGVYRVSLDAPMVNASNNDDTIILREEFETTPNSHWEGIWAEIGEYDGFEAGDVKFTSFLNGSYQGVRIQTGSKGIQGTADLSRALSATLSITYRRKNFSDSDAISIQISADGGENWTELERLTGPVTDPDISQAQYNITPFTSDNTIVRFLSSDHLNDRARFYLDAVQIEYTPQLQPALTLPYTVMLPVVITSGSPADSDFNSPQFDGTFGATNECNGLLQEAELATLYGNFAVGYDSGASGNQYIYTPEGVGSFYNGPENEHRADFCFHIPTAGAYQIRGWVYAPDTGSDSFYLRANGQPTASFAWHTNMTETYQAQYAGEISGNPIAVYLPEGDQLITIYDREDGTRLDKLELEFVGNEDLETVEDKFDTVAYNNNNGGVDWLTDWVEVGESSRPNSGDITVEVDYCPTNGEQCIEFDGDVGVNAAIERGVDLGDAVSASLTFDYRLDSDDATYILEASMNDGRNWVTLRSYSTEERVFGETVDLSNFRTHNSLIRFRLVDLDTAAHFYIDDVQVAYVTENGATETVRDEFNNIAYNNNDGSADWRTDWLETRDGNNPSSGDITIEVDYCPTPSGQCVEFDGDVGVGHALQRGVDLGDALTATLTFDYRVDHDGVTYALDVSHDGGSNWTTLRTYSEEANVLGESVDLTPYIGANTQIRFRLAEGFSYYHLYIDNVKIEYETAVLPSTPFKEDNGEIVIEAENYQRQIVGETNDLWSTTTNFGDFSGATALQALPNDGNNVGLNPTGPELQYEVAFTNPGTYYVYARGLAPDGSTADDSIHIGLNGALVTGSGYGASGFDDYFSWHSYNDGGKITINIPAPGTYTINVWMREDGFVFDKLWITKEQYPYTTVSELGPDESQRCADCIATTQLNSPYIQAIGADKLWEEPYTIQGQAITVAVVDSGIANHDDLDYAGIGKSRIVKQYHYNSGAPVVPDDYYGHGTHVAGIIGGNGNNSAGDFMGVAPQVNFIDIKVMDDYGVGLMSDVVEGLEWINENKDKYNIRVVNLSLNSAEADSYHDSPLNAALEILWFNDVVVVVSAGNNGSDHSGILYPPANDPFVITVGAVDDMGTAIIQDDVLSSFSAYGTTQEGFTKPDLVAPGTDIISLLASDDANLIIDHPDHAVDGTDYFRMSGTSMSSAVVAGAAALLLCDEPYLTPDQVKYRLMSTARTDWPGYNPQESGAGYLDIFAAAQSETIASADTDAVPHMLLAKMALIAYWASENGDENIDWANVDWNAVNWDVVDWNSVNWGSVNWGSVNWGSVNWGSVNWGSVNWGSVNWGSVNWGSVNWGSVNWGSVNWGSVNWGSVDWDD